MAGNSHDNVDNMSHGWNSSAFESNCPGRCARFGFGCEKIGAVVWNDDACKEDETPEEGLSAMCATIMNDSYLGTHMNMMRTLQKVCLMALGRSREGFLDSAAVMASISVPQ